MNSWFFKGRYGTDLEKDAKIFRSFYWNPEEVFADGMKVIMNHRNVHFNYNNLNIYQYLRLVLLYMPDYKNEPDGIEDMMPWSEFMAENCSKIKKTDKEIRLVSKK